MDIPESYTLYKNRINKILFVECGKKVALFIKIHQIDNFFMYMLKRFCCKVLCFIHGADFIEVHLV